MSQLAKIMQYGKQFVSFLFSYQGTINRIQYFLGFILINLFAYAFRNGGPFVVLLLVEFLYLYILFAFVQKRCRDINKDAKGIVIGLSISIVLVMIYKQLPLERNILIYPFIVGVTIMAILIHLYLMVTPGVDVEQEDVEPVQQTLGRLNSIVLPAFLELVMVLTIVAGYTWFSKHHFLFNAPVTAYTNQYAYAKACQKYGYELVNYPQKFADYYGEDIHKIEKKLSAYGFRISYILSEENIDLLDDAVQSDLNLLKQNVTLDKVAKEKNLPREGLVWQDEYDNYMTMQDVCRYIDEQADVLIQSNTRVANVFKKALQ